MKSVAIYGRVSSEKQTDNFSIPTQLQLMRDYFAAQGQEVIELAETGSAFTEGLTRSKLQQALELAREHKISALMFFSPDRFTRDMADGVILRRELRRCGVALWCYYPSPYEITSEQEILNILTDWRNEEFIRNLRASSMRGVRGKVDAGMFPQGHAPYGYRLRGEKRTTEIYIDEYERAVIQDIFDWYHAHDIGVTEITKRLNARGVPCPKNTRGATEWTIRAVRKILNKKAYTGVWYAYTWHHIDKKWIKKPEREENVILIPEIIPAHIFERVQEKLASRHAGKREDSQYLMSCRLRCSCGGRMSGKRTGSGAHGGQYYYYYRCNLNIDGPALCDAKYVSSKDVDNTVWQFALDFIQNPEALLTGLRSMQEEDRTKYDFISAQIEHLDEQIAEGERSLSSIVDQRIKTQIPTLIAILDERAQTLAEAVEGMKTRRSTLIAEQVRAPFTDEHIAQVAQEVEELRKVYEALHLIDEEEDFEAQRALINLLDLTATIRQEGKGHIWVDITYLRKTYPRELLLRKALAQRRSV